MPVQPPQNTPSDLTFLLGQIDGKVTGIAQTLTAMDTRAQNHEDRILKLEAHDAVRSTYVPRFEAVERKVGELESVQDQGRGWLQAGAAVKAMIGMGIAVIGYLGWQVAVEPASPPTIEQKTVQRTTIPVEPTKRH